AGVSHDSPHALLCHRPARPGDPVAPEDPLVRPWTGLARWLLGGPPMGHDNSWHATSQHLEHVVGRAACGARAGRDRADLVDPFVALGARLEIRRDAKIIQARVDGF